MLSILFFSALINCILASSKFIDCLIFLLSLTLKNIIPSDIITGFEISPIGVLDIIDLYFCEIIFSLSQPKSPPFIAVSEILISIATFSKPSILILSLISLIFFSS